MPGKVSICHVELIKLERFEIVAVASSIATKRALLLDPCVCVCKRETIHVRKL